MNTTSTSLKYKDFSLFKDFIELSIFKKRFKPIAKQLNIELD